MTIPQQAGDTVRDATYLSLVTVNPDGTPHPIVVEKGKVDGDSIVFGIYKMEVTRRNLAQNPTAYVVCATTSSGPVGFRFTGTAQPTDTELIFTPSKIDALI